MKTEASLKKYFARRRDEISSLLKKPARKFTPENFHRLRVEIKKLNAFCALINYKSKDFKRKKTFKPLKRIFKQAGKVREIQLEEAILKKYNFHSSLKDYLSNLKKSLVKERKIFFSISTEKFQIEIKRSLEGIASFIETIDKKKTKQYIERRMEKIKTLICQKNLEAKQLHELRKRLKEFYYNIKSVNLKRQNDQLHQKENFQEMIGKWHDFQVMTGHLKNVIDANGMNPKEVVQLEMIKAELTSDSDRLFKKINELIPLTEFFGETG